MVCPECNGTGETVYFVEVDRDENSVTCEKKKGICRTCMGSGKKPMTNGDRIRAMSDKELAWFLAERYAKESVLRLRDSGCEPTATQIKVLTEQLYYTWVRWLQQPVEDE